MCKDFGQFKKTMQESPRIKKWLHMQHASTKEDVQSVASWAKGSDCPWNKNEDVSKVQLDL